jgi:hypothetical protein
LRSSRLRCDGPRTRMPEPSNRSISDVLPVVERCHLSRCGCPTVVIGSVVQEKSNLAAPDRSGFRSTKFVAGC